MLLPGYYKLAKMASHKYRTNDHYYFIFSSLLDQNRIIHVVYIGSEHD